MVITITTDIKIYGTIMSNDSAEIMRYYGYKNLCCPSDLEKALSEKNDNEINIYINSQGGSLFAGTEMYSMIRAEKRNVTAHIQSVAASSATMPMIACKKIIADPTSLICIHNPTSYAEGDVYEMQRTSDELTNVKEAIINAYIGKLSKTRDEISQLMDKNLYLDAAKALEFGLIDEISDVKTEIVNSSGEYMFPTAEMREKYYANKILAENQKKKRIQAILNLNKLI